MKSSLAAPSIVKREGVKEVEMKHAVIVQARTGSSRYPKKMLHPFHGKTAIDWVLSRCAGIECDTKILVTTEGEEDEVLADAAEKLDWLVVRGAVHDVLSRFATAVRRYELDTVVRITGDCLFTDYRMVNQVLHWFSESAVDYFTLSHVIDGFDVEVISGRALLAADRQAKLPSEREHVTPWIKKHGDYKKIVIPYTENDFSKIHLSLDYKEDAQVIDRILGQLNRSDFSYEEVIALIEAAPKLIQDETTARVGAGSDISAKEDKRWIQSRIAPPLKLEESLKHHREVMKIIPGGSQTFSKSALQFSHGAAPLYVKEGKGAWLTDLDGNRYLDFTMGLGACILGYAYEPVVEAIKKQLDQGSSFTLPHRLEYELSALLTEIIPSAEMVRLAKNGSDVTAAAVRVSRAYTGRNYIACCGYHGWQDWYIGSTTRSQGIPVDVRHLTLNFAYNKIESLEALFEQYPDEIACVIMEPVSLEAPDADFLKKVKELAHRYGALLVFDEVVTGFRMSLGGAQSYFDVLPDLSCFGKAMGNGLPISALVGKKEIMRHFNEVFFSTTFGGETASIAAAIATIKSLQEQDVYAQFQRIGEKLKTGVSALIEDKEMARYFSIEGYSARSFLMIKEDSRFKLKTLFQQECVKRGLLFTGGHNMALPHDEALIELTLRIYDEVMDIVKYGLEYGMIDSMIEGKRLEAVFRKV